MRGFESTAFRDPRSVRKTMNGTGMVAPVKSVTVTYQSGRSEVLKAGVTRLSPDHPLVKQRPGLFRPADSSDKATATRMLELAGSSGRVLEQATRSDPAVRTKRTHGRHQLRRRRQQRSQLR